MNKVILLLLATSVALGATTLHLVRVVRAERETAQALQERVAELERASAVQANPFAATPAATPAETPFAPATTAATSPPEPAEPEKRATPARIAPVAVSGTFGYSGPNMPSREERMRMMRENMERQRALLRDPDYRDALRMQHKAMFTSTYPDLSAELGMTAEETDRFMTLLADQQLRSMENQTPWMFDGQPDPAAVQEMQRKAGEWSRTTETEIAGLLGPEKLRAWKEYQSTLGVRHQVKQMGASLASQGTPLREDQIKPLQRALVDAEQRRAQEWSRNAPHVQTGFVANAFAAGSLETGDAVKRLQFQEDQLRQLREHNQRIRDSLAPILTPEQLAHFEEQQEAQLKLQQAHLRMMRAQAEAEARGEIAPAQQNLYIDGVSISSN